MCKNLLYPCSQTPKDISHMRPEGCFPVGCLSLGQGICLSEGRWVRVFLQSRCGRWWHFPLYQISSLDDHAVGHGEKLCLTVCSQGLFFLTSSVTLLFTEPWNSLPQASMEAKGLGIFQEEQGLFPGWEFPEWHWMGKKKKNLPQTDEHLQPPRKEIRNLRFAWSGFAVISGGVSPTRVSSSRS